MPNYRLLTDLGEIFNKAQLCLLRRVDDINEDADEERIVMQLTNSLLESRSKINEYSLNLLGGKFKVEHLSYTVKTEKGKDDSWTEGKVCSISDFTSRITVKDNYSLALFMAEDLHDVSLIAEPDIKNQKILTNINDKRDKDDTPSENIKMKTLLLHQPTIFNYWHVQIHFYDCEGNRFPSSNSKLNQGHKAVLYSFIQTVFIPKVKFKKDITLCNDTIEPSWYQRTEIPGK